MSVAVGAGGAVLGACSSRVSEYVVGAYPVHMVSSNTVPLLLRGCVWGPDAPISVMRVRCPDGGQRHTPAPESGPFSLALAESQNTVRDIANAFALSNIA